PPITGPGGVHRLLWVEAPGRVGLCDFGPGGQARTAVVPLAADPLNTLAPIRSAVRVAGDKVDIYLLVDNLNDVIHIRVDLAATELDVSLDQIAAGADPADLHVFDTTAGLRVLVANVQAKSLSVLDPATGSGLEIPLDGVVRQFRVIPAPDGKARVLAWSPGSGLNFLYVVNLDDLAKKKGKAIERIAFDFPIVDLLPVAGKVLVRHQSTSVGLSLLDVVGGTATQFKGTGNLIDLRAIDGPSGATAWLLGSNGSDLRLSRIDLATLHGDSTPLHSTGQNLSVSAGLYRVGDGLAVVGSGLAGLWAAWLPNQPIAAKNMVWFEGFALERWLQGGAP
ncbi:MAG: hypothetical protein HY902_21290, partial [Deltaproteobacteria bacterium]|nr:hypothetical protein [Deltaproteobacteria bacterium]